MGIKEMIFGNSDEAKKESHSLGQDEAIPQEEVSERLSKGTKIWYAENLESSGFEVRVVLDKGGESVLVRFPDELEPTGPKEPKWVPRDHLSS